MKILAIIAAGAWTYYQWDRVFFPEATAEREARAAGDRVDLEISVGEVYIESFGPPYFDRKSVSGGESDEGNSLQYLVELGGSITIRNNRKFPIQLEVTSTDLSVAFSFEESDANELYLLSLKEEINVVLDGKKVFGEIIEEGLTLENDGVVRLSFRVPLVISDRVISQPHEYRFTSLFELSEVSIESGTSKESNIKSKRVIASVFINGPVEADRSFGNTRTKWPMFRSGRRIEGGEMNRFPRELEDLL